MALPRIGRMATISTAVVTTALTTYALVVYSRISRVNRKQVTMTDNVPDSFHNSATMRSIVNPKRHVTFGDTHVMTFNVPAAHQHLSDEALLARFVREFYNGWVFTPERYLLRLWGGNLVGFPETASSPVPARVWDVSLLSEDKLPPLHSTILGAWQVVDVNLPEQSEAPNHAESSVDLAFGNGNWHFAGSNRFSLRRLNKIEGGQLVSQAQIVYACTTCDPLFDKRPMPRFMERFHRVYAMLLYREAMGGLLHELNESPSLDYVR